jgi:protein TonB
MEERRRFLILGGVISVGFHLCAFAYANLMASSPADSSSTRSTTQVELVAAAPEPEAPPPPVPRPPPRPILVAKTPKVEGVPQPKPAKTEPFPPEQPQPTEAKPQNSTATGEVSSGPPAAGEMVSPIPATGGGVGSESPAGGPINSGTSGSGTTTASRGNASFTSAAPDYLHNPPPEYPEEARISHQQGVVLLLVDVSQEGGVLKVSLQRSSGYRRLDEAALRVAKNWKFKPATVAGQPMRSQVEVPVRFKLQ